MLNIGGIEADGDLHLVKYAEGVLLYLQRGNLNTHIEGFITVLLWV